MQRVRSHYKKAVGTLLAVAITAQFLVLQFLLPVMGRPQGVLGWILTSTSIYTALFLFPLFLYEKWGWRWFAREIDIGGRWTYSITYNASSGSRETINFVSELPTSGQVEVVQDPFHLQLTSGMEKVTRSEAGEAVTSWRSTSAELVGDILVFSAEFRVKNRLLSALETASIQLERGRPVRMHSQFVIVESGRKPIAYGEVYYVRVDA